MKRLYSQLLPFVFPSGFIPPLDSLSLSLGPHQPSLSHHEMVCCLSYKRNGNILHGFGERSMVEITIFDFDASITDIDN